MAVFLSCIGFLGGIVCFIWFIICLARGQPKKTAGAGILICFIVFMVGGFLNLPATTDKGEESKTSQDFPAEPEDSNGDVDLTNSTISPETPKQNPLDEFLIAIGTDIGRESIEDTATNLGLYIDYKNNGLGIYTYRIAEEKEIANVNHPEKGSYITVSFDGLNNDSLEKITYFDEKRMIAGYWEPETGYRVADYNYPQIVYLAEGSDKAYSSQVPVNDAKAIIEYSLSEDPGENLLEVLFSLVTPETTKKDLLTFVDAHKLSYNSRGTGNCEIIAYCYNIGDKYGEIGSYITFSEDENGLITQMTYLYYPQNYRNGDSISFYSEAYAAHYSTPSGFIFKNDSEFTECQSAEELLEKLHKEGGLNGTVSKPR